MSEIFNNDSQSKKKVMKVRLKKDETPKVFDPSKEVDSLGNVKKAKPHEFTRRASNGSVKSRFGGLGRSDGFSSRINSNSRGGGRIDFAAARTQDNADRKSNLDNNSWDRPPREGGFNREGSSAQRRWFQP